ncbi:MAG: hypothetical protein EOP06_02680 [Proteobacteria bacterium]|nr:MAG: hypothetical protein EOP06_02680 [Pseudomonadota bacterium]
MLQTSACSINEGSFTTFGDGVQHSRSNFSGRHFAFAALSAWISFQSAESAQGQMFTFLVSLIFASMVALAGSYGRFIRFAYLMLVSVIGYGFGHYFPAGIFEHFWVWASFCLVWGSSLLPAPWNRVLILSPAFGINRSATGLFLKHSTDTPPYNTIEELEDDIRKSLPFFIEDSVLLIQGRFGHWVQRAKHLYFEYDYLSNSSIYAKNNFTVFFAIAVRLSFDEFRGKGPFAPKSLFNRFEGEESRVVRH